MLKRILVPLDGSAFSQAATQYSIEVARLTQASLVGLAIIDKEIERTGPVPIGGGVFADQIQERRMVDAQARSKECLAQFEAEASKAKIQASSQIEAGVPHEVILELSKTTDLVVIGQKTFFHYETQDDPGDTFKKLIDEAVKPTLAVPEEISPLSRFLISWDGSFRASRALDSFLQLGLFAHHETHLVTIGDDTMKEMYQRAQDYLDAHGVTYKASLIPNGKPVYETLWKYVEKHKIDALVLGSSGHNLLREFFFGSTAKGFLNEGGLPILLDH